MCEIIRIQGLLCKFTWKSFLVKELKILYHGHLFSISLTMGKLLERFIKKSCKRATDVDTSKLAPKFDLASLKAQINNLDKDKL